MSMETSHSTPLRRSTLKMPPRKNMMMTWRQGTHQQGRRGLLAAVRNRQAGMRCFKAAGHKLPAEWWMHGALPSMQAGRAPHLEAADEHPDDPEDVRGEEACKHVVLVLHLARIEHVEHLRHAG